MSEFDSAVRVISLAEFKKRRQASLPRPSSGRAKREAAAALGKRLNIAFGLGHIYETDGA
jgi:hypothetical protein